MHFYSPNDLSSGYLNRTFNPYLTNPLFYASPINQRGAALVLSNVVSFQVQVSKDTNPAKDFEDLGLVDSNGKNIPFDTPNYLKPTPSVPLPPLPPAYGNNVTAPAPTFSIQALRITLRIWDPKSRFTRPFSIQALRITLRIWDPKSRLLGR